MNIKIITNPLIPPDTILIAPNLEKYFKAVIAGDREELEKYEADLAGKVGAIRNLLNGDKS